jgi:ABC-type nitrate/sulfonate/bicarbonate transport systems, periplasmic components
MVTYPLSVTGAEIAGKPEKPEVTVAYVSPSAAFTPLYVAADTGLFAKYGLKLKPQIIGVGTGQKALISEEIDILVDGPLLIAARLGGAAVKYFGAYTQRYIFQIWGVKGITAIEQLKGKLVAVSAPRGAIEIATREALRKQGLNPDADVKYIYNDQVPAILTAVVTGTVSAGTLSTPLNLKARDAGLNLLLDIAKLNVPGLGGAYGATEKFSKTIRILPMRLAKPWPKEWRWLRRIMRKPREPSVNTSRSMIRRYLTSRMTTTCCTLRRALPCASK